MNPSPSAGRFCGLKGSTHHLCPDTRLAFWSRGLGQHSRTASTHTKQTQSTAFFTHVLTLSAVEILHFEEKPNASGIEPSISTLLAKVGPLDHRGAAVLYSPSLLSCTCREIYGTAQPNSSRVVFVQCLRNTDCTMMECPALFSKDDSTPSCSSASCTRTPHSRRKRPSIYVHRCCHRSKVCDTDFTDVVHIIGSPILSS